MELLLPTMMIGLIGLACGTALAVAARFFAVKEDPRVSRALDLLPGMNCGACGFAGCSEYARAVVLDGTPINLCSPGGPAVSKKLGGFLGRSAEHVQRKVALVLCNGDVDKAPRRSAYNGIADCWAAQAVNGGDKACRYGCLGYGSCARVCPTNAIEITPGGLARVHPDLCISCEACVKACPRSIIRMVPDSSRIHVLCVNPDKGPDVKKVCSVGCIGCSVCAKLAENGAIRMEGRLAVVDYSRPAANPVVIEKCPAGTIVSRPLGGSAPADPQKTAPAETQAAPA